MTIKYGPWIVWGKKERPEGLSYNQRIEVVCHGEDGELKLDLSDRHVGAHAWTTGRTLAYRVKIKEETCVVHGQIGGMFTALRDTSDTHKITYVVRDGEVVSCEMEKL